MDFVGHDVRSERSESCYDGKNSSILSALNVESDILIHELDRSNYLIYGNQSTNQLD